MPVCRCAGVQVCKVCRVAEVQSRCKGAELQVVRAGESHCRGVEEMQRRCRGEVGAEVQIWRC